METKVTRPFEHIFVQTIFPHRCYLLLPVQFVFTVTKSEARIETMPIHYLNGRRLKHGIIAGAESVILRKEY
ncbi:MAG: hypothetical protein ACK412_10115, partial [Chloroherpetonaceae bacterium]